MKKRIIWILPLCLAVICFVANFMFGQPTLTKDGVLHEPLFFLIPLGFLCLFIALSAAVTQLVVAFLHKKAENDDSNE